MTDAWLLTAYREQVKRLTAEISDLKKKLRKLETTAATKKAAPKRKRP